MKRLIITMLIIAAAVFIAAPVTADTGIPGQADHTGALAILFALGVGMALSANEPRTYELGDINELPVAASTTIYEGAAVGDNGSGYARGLVAGDPFRGFAEAKADNSDGSAGDINVRVRTRGIIYATFSSIAITNVDDDVYMSDDGTFTLTAGSNTWIGKVYRYIDSTHAMVSFNVDWYKDIGAADIGADAVNSSKIADDSIDSEHYVDGSIDTAHLAADAVDGTKIADDAVDSEHIAAGAVDLEHMSANSVDSDQYVDGSIDTDHLSADCVTGAKIADDAVSSEHLDDGILPAYVVKYAGEFTTQGGDATEEISVTGVLDTDICLVTLHTKGSTPRTILTAQCSTDTITVVMSDDPSTDHVLSYIVLRAVS